MISDRIVQVAWIAGWLIVAVSLLEAENQLSDVSALLSLGIALLGFAMNVGEQ